jgi:septum formation protein
MLKDAGVKFEVIAPICDEEEVKKQLGNLTLNFKALQLAKAKAKSVSDIYIDKYVIGSDQICEFEGEVISKSKTAEEAFLSLKKLANKTHKQNNGTCIYYNGNCVLEHIEIAELTMKKLSDDQIWTYVKLDNPIGCAGSYKFELNGKNLFTKINGSAEAIQGFSVSKVVGFLENLSIN